MILPTFTANGATIADFRRAWAHAMAAPNNHDRLAMYFYAASVGGWEDVRPEVAAWLAKAAREAVAYIGTDHGLTDPQALRNIKQAGVKLRLLTRYEGFFHPKLVVLSGNAGGTILAGSNNLSASGLTKNFEFALGVRYQGAAPPELQGWIDAVEAASEDATDALIADYERERKRFEAQTKALSKRFAWSRRSKAAPPPPVPLPAGALIMEIMDKETGQDGKQVQPPLATLGPFWNFPAGLSKVVKARLKGQAGFHDLTLSRMQNSTARLHIAELDYGHRPGFLVFTKVAGGYEYDIVTRAQQPGMYLQIENLPLKQTRAGSRRWTVQP